MSMSTASFEAVRSYVDGRAGEGQAPGADDDLFVGVITDSLDFVEFLLVVEEARAEPIPADAIDIEAFRTLNRIRETFFAAA